MLSLQLVIGGIIIGLTVIIHALLYEWLYAAIGRNRGILARLRGRMRRLTVNIFTVLVVFMALVIDIWIWALFYLYVESMPIDTLESALYFSMASFTTVGYGDIVLGPDWRLISSIEAVNGLLMFGWSTAFIFEMTSKFYRNWDSAT